MKITPGARGTRQVRDSSSKIVTNLPSRKVSPKKKINTLPIVQPPTTQHTAPSKQIGDAFALVTTNKTAKTPCVGNIPLHVYTPEPPHTPEAIALREGFIVAPSRAFGEKFIEPIIREIYGWEETGTTEYDAKIPGGGRVEIKSARAFRVKQLSHPKNLLEQILVTKNDTQNLELVSFTQRHTEKYDCNIQNIKRDAFDEMIYVVAYDEGIEIFRVKNSDINKDNIPNWSGKHGRHDEVGKNGQFSVHSKNLHTHEGKYFEQFITYEQLADIARGITYDENGKKHHNSKPNQT